MTRCDDTHANDDLSPRHRIDAGVSEADALDARLNEIAQNSGRATAQPDLGQTSRSQSRDTETDELSEFAQAFHQRVARVDAAESGHSALDPTLWEQIMATQAASSNRVATRSTLGPGQFNGRRPPGGNRPTSGAFDRAPQRKGGFWTSAANATLAVLLIAVAFGGWRVYERVQNGPSEHVPGLAFQPETHATPETISVPPVDVSTPEPAFACDFSHDIPIFPQVDESPISGTALLVTTSDELALSCPEEPESIVLATNIGQAGPTQWPGIVYTASPFDQGEMPDVEYVNAFTGNTVEVGVYMSESSTTTGLDGSPWHVAPAPDDSGAWAITDFRTMETWPLSSFIEMPQTFPPGTSMMTAASGDTVVVGIKTENGIEGDGYLFDVEGLPGTLLVVNGSFEDAHWIDVPEDLASTRRIELSPGGKFLALKSNDGEASFDGTITYTIIRVSDGVEVARTEGIEDFSSEMRWVQDGAALAYTNTNALMLLTTDGSDSPVTLLESPHPLANLCTTYNSDVILARQQQPEEIATETPELVQPLTYSVNTVTGDSVEFLGADASINLSPYQQDTRFIVLTDSYVRDGEPHTYRVIDSVTGEQVGTIDNVATPLNQGGYPSLGPHSIASTDDGSTEVLGFSLAELWLMTMDGESPVVRQLASPPGKEDATQGLVNIFLSPDGSMLSLTVEGDESRTRYLLDLTDPVAEWLEVPSTMPSSNPGYILFLPGTGD